MLLALGRHILNRGQDIVALLHCSFGCPMRGCTTCCAPHLTHAAVDVGSRWRCWDKGLCRVCVFLSEF